MPVVQSKRPRPTFQTAHDFYKDGLYLVTGPDCWRSYEEHFTDWVDTRQKLKDIVKKEFPRTNILEYAVLKSHLIIEFAIDQFIRSLSRGNNFDRIAKFNFSHKLEIAILLGFGINDPALIPTIERISKIRNEAAHKFTLDRPGLDEVFRINSDEYDGFAVEHDRERIKRLRWICHGVCAQISTDIFVYVTCEIRDRKPLSEAMSEGELPDPEWEDDND